MQFYCRLLVLVLLSAPWQVKAENAGDQGYRLGRGYPLGQTGIRLGGYASVGVDAPRAGPWQFSVSDLSLFTIWDNGHRWRFFSETEVGDALSAGEHQDLGVRNAHFELERLYVDYLASDAAVLRFGKFLTPIGRWNLLHANPLVWTTTRPVATYQLFSRNATGLMLYGALSVIGRRFEYGTYTTVTDSLDPYKSENPFENAFGAHVLYSLSDELDVGMSYANYELHDEPGARFNLLGVEGSWSYRQFEVSTEWVYRSGGIKDLAQGFLQGVVPVVGHWYSVLRYEYFQRIQGPAGGYVGVFGLAFRPTPPLVWKLEYRLGVHNESAAPDGIYGSFSVLF